MHGKSNRDLYQADPDYRDDFIMYEKCKQYATAYTHILLRRAEVADPEFFAVKGINKDEMEVEMIQGMCLPQAQVKALSFRNTTAKIFEKRYLNDEIRRLYNGGDRFHPYL